VRSERGVKKKNNSQNKQASFSKRHLTNVLSLVKEVPCVFAEVGAHCLNII